MDILSNRRSIPTTEELLPILFNEGNAKCYLIENNIIQSVMLCNNYGKTISANLERECFRHRFSGRQVEKSIWSHTLFARSNLRPSQVLHFAHLWLSGATQTVIAILTGHSSKTVSNFAAEFNQLVAHEIEESSCVVGGEGIVVEIDETKFGKRKNNRGHHVDGVWVVVGVERTLERRMFAVPVQNRNEATLYEVISNHVRPGSIIHTDCWRGYSFLRHIDEVEHLTVNHSQTFRDPVTGVHTNTVEGTNFALKRWIPVRNRTENDLGPRLFSFIWNRQHDNSLWMPLLGAMSRVPYE